LQVFRADGTFVRVIGSQGDANDQFRLPLGVAYDAASNIVVSDCYHKRHLRVFRADGQLLRAFGEEPEVGYARSVSVDGAGRILLTQSTSTSGGGGHCLQRWA
jgi:hypothetical protein